MGNVPYVGLNLPPRKTEATPAAFDVACFCGARLTGTRLVRHQVVVCSICGASRLILPLSPLPDVPSDRVSAPGEARNDRWRWLAGAALIGFVAVIVAVALTRRTEPTTSTVEAPATEGEMQRCVQEARAAAAEGAYLRAERAFGSALEIQRRLGNSSTGEQRRLLRLHRQSSLLADLLAESPAAIVRHSVGMSDADWQDVFRQRYAGRSMVLDDTISRNAAGQYQYSFRIVVLNNEARIDLSRLKALHDLPLLQPQRMLLGLRLESVRREAPGGWTILPDPDSGVLFTDPELLTGLSIPVDAELREVLKRQLTWLESPQ